MKNYTRKDTRTLEQVSKAVATMRKQVAKKVAAYEKSHMQQTAASYTVLYKFIGEIAERTYTGRFETTAAVEEHLMQQTAAKDISYCLYGKQGTAREDMQLLAFI